MGRLTRSRFVAAVSDIAGRDPRTLAVELMRQLGGHRIPAPRKACHVERDTRIRAALDSGETLDAVANRERLSRRRVVDISSRSD